MASAATLWAKGSGETPLYSDWKVSFVTSEGSVSKDSKKKKKNVKTIFDNSMQQQPNEPRKEQFSVHRNMIGPKSAFFTNSFLGAAQAKSNSSTIALPCDLPQHTFASVVEAFELLLDFCYISNGKFEPERKLTTENAVTMFCLSHYFGMDSVICDKVKAFIESDLSQGTVARYYQILKDMRSATQKESIILDTKPIMEMVVSMCHKTPTVLDSKTDLFQIADLSLWLSVGSLLAHDDEKPEDEETSVDASKIWSENLTSFFDTYDEANTVDLKESFCTLTSSSILPEVSPKVALRLLEFERKLGLAGLSSSKDVEHTSDDDTVCTTDCESDSDAEGDVTAASKLTNLQKRCVKALCKSNWAGEENDVESKRGKLIELTTPDVLEALLIDSVKGERALNTKMEMMKASVESEEKALEQQIEMFKFKQDDVKYETAMQKQKIFTLERKLKDAHKAFENSQAKMIKLEEAKAKLQAELDTEKKRNSNNNLRFRELETAQIKTENDKENFEMTLKETIKRLDALTSSEETGTSLCGMQWLVFLISAMSDHKECEKIKVMLKQVLKDPQTYERDFLVAQDTITVGDAVTMDDDAEDTDTVDDDAEDDDTVDDDAATTDTLGEDAEDTLIVGDEAVNTESGCSFMGLNKDDITF